MRRGLMLRKQPGLLAAYKGSFLQALTIGCIGSPINPAPGEPLRCSRPNVIYR